MNVAGQNVCVCEKVAALHRHSIARCSTTSYARAGHTCSVAANWRSHEQRARGDESRDVQAEWSQIAIEWHSMANAAAARSSPDPDLYVM